VRGGWLFSRTICVMTLLRDFLQPNPHTAMLFSPFGYIYQPTSPVPPFLLPLNQYPKEIAGSDITSCLTHTMYAKAFKAAWRVMQTLEICADTKSCQDISRLLKIILLDNIRYCNAGHPGCCPGVDHAISGVNGSVVAWLRCMFRLPKVLTQSKGNYIVDLI